MKPLSNDLRERILAAVDKHEGSRRKLAARFAVDVSTITRLLELRRQNGGADPRPHAGGGLPFRSFPCQMLDSHAAAFWRPAGCLRAKAGHFVWRRLENVRQLQHR
jgi:hypothetical protein